MRTGSSVRSSVSVSAPGHAISRESSRFDHLAALLALFGLFVAFDDVDAHFGQHRHHVLDLVRLTPVRAAERRSAGHR
jgi:hypothetical protein